MPHRPVKILAVDDTPQNLLALHALIDDDAMLLTAASGTEALEMLLAHDVALVLMDVQMPGMDGFEVAELMRGTRRTRRVPIIFVTADVQERQRTFRGYEAGAVDFLFKPLDPLALKSKVRVFIELHRQRLMLAERIAEHERLQRINRQMLAALSYDIRQPLTALQLNAEVLLRRGDETGRRVKTATALLSRCVDHLVNLAARPSDDVRVEMEEAHVGELVRQRLDQQADQTLATAPEYTLEGDDRARFDPALLREAVDHLLLQAAVHAGAAPVRVHVDGLGRHAVTLVVAFDTTLSAAAASHVLGAGAPLDGLAPHTVGPALEAVERAARLHGGSLVARSQERSGTRFELLLPRGLSITP